LSSAHSNAAQRCAATARCKKADSVLSAKIMIFRYENHDVDKQPQCGVTAVIGSQVATIFDLHYLPQSNIRQGLEKKSVLFRLPGY
jgi:C4-dicarboxylate transporter